MSLLKFKFIVLLETLQRIHTFNNLLSFAKLYTHILYYFFRFFTSPTFFLKKTTIITYVHSAIKRDKN